MDELQEIIIDEEITEPKAKAEGVPWDKLKFKISSRDFAKIMKENDLTTYEDVRTNTQLVVRLLQSLYRVDLGVVLAFAKEYEEVE
jgi:hypothetical protein